MQRIKHISIPQPCPQLWDEMNPAGKARHCLQCAKNVVDFTTMADAEVISYLSSSTKTCGRFSPNQLSRINYQIAAKPRRAPLWKGFFALASLMILSPVLKAGAGPVTKTTVSSILFPGGVGNRALSGIIVSGDDAKPLMGVSIALKGTSTGTQTAADGSFKLFSVSRKDTLLVSHIGYKTIELPAAELIQGVIISLQTETAVLNEVLVNGYGVQRRTSILGAIATVCHCKEPFFKRVWLKLKDIF